MRVAILADTHFGARNDSQNFDSFFKKFYENTFFPFMEENKIKTLIHLGDVFDRRKYINFNTLKSAKKYFFEPLQELEIDMKIIIGNHDTYYKNTNEVNSLDLLLRQYPNIEILEKPIIQEIDNQSCSFVPWICSDNYDECMEVLKQSTRYCFGHFEIEGFYMFRGVKNDHGLNRNLLKDYEMVLTGHFHHRNTDDNIYYLGSPYGFTWNDFDDPRGFHVLDLQTSEISFIQNPNIIFKKIHYDDRKPLPKPSDFSECCVKVTVVHKTDYHKFDKFIDGLYANDVLELTIHEDFSEFESDALDDNINVEDTVTLLSDYVDSTESTLDKEKIKTLLKTLYVEAQNLEI